MLARVFNLLLASGMACVASALIFDNWRSLDATSLGFLLVAACWLAGAIGLFFGKRLAWWGSMLGTGVVLAYSLGMIWMAWDLWRLTPTDPESSVGHGFTQVTAVVGFFMSFVVTAAMLGLIQLRKEMAGKWK